MIFSTLKTVLALPIAPLLPDVVKSLSEISTLVLQADPGAGKTTSVPLALLDAPFMEKKRLILLEPRRLAARSAAMRMAEMLGEPVGEQVGYFMRFDKKFGPRTRVLVVTEGILAHLIQKDPELPGVGAILFDEFHERSLSADLGLALCLDLANALRPDLRLVAMSATMEAEALSALLGGAPILRHQGRNFPVDIRWLEQSWKGRFEDGIVQLIERAFLDEKTGDILAFLPGGKEIRRTLRALQDRRLDAEIAPLYGDLGEAEQKRALRPLANRRKIILATNIAETSLTIEGVSIVVDGGRTRLSRFDPGTGMSRLTTEPESKASAEQRRGRAGRLGPGFCYRLWTEAEHRGLKPYSEPEITRADLAPLALELARWGTNDPASLSWLNPPLPAHFSQAQALLADLGALDTDGRVTSHGQAMARLGTHPRLAHMMLKGQNLGQARLASILAALLSERDIFAPGSGADMAARVRALRTGGRDDWRSVRNTAHQLLRQIALGENRTEAPMNDALIGPLIAFAYPDRIAKRRSALSLNYRMSNGRGAHFAEAETLASEEYLAVAALDGDKKDARLYLAAPLSLSDIETFFEDRIVLEQRLFWDERSNSVQAVEQRLLGRLPLVETKSSNPDPELMRTALLEGIRSMGLNCLPWNDKAQKLRARILFLHRQDKSGDWPDLSDDALADDLELWLAPWLSKMSRKNHLEQLDMHEILSSLLSWEQKNALERMAPTHIDIPSGTRAPIDYQTDPPVLAVRLQEMFGSTGTPTIMGGKMRLMLHLLSPARRPVQITQDLTSFWSGAYKAVKAELKGQYPKHHWPDDPLAARPTARIKRQKDR